MENCHHSADVPLTFQEVLAERIKGIAIWIVLRITQKKKFWT